MPFAGGIFTRLHRWVGDANTSAQLFDNDGDDVAVALSNCVLRDGSGNPSADIPWNNHKITSLATAAQDDNSQQAATTAFVVGQAGAATPLVDGTAAPGSSLRYARQDHVHPTDTTRMAVANNLSEVTNAPLARAYLGAAVSGANNDITSMSALSSVSANLSISKGSPTLSLAASASGQLAALTGSVAGKLRWTVSPGDGTSEGGSNSGSNFAVYRYNDAGTLVDTPLSISRANGVTSLSQPLPVSSGGTGGITAAAGRAGIGAAASGANADITSMSGLGTLSSNLSIGKAAPTLSLSGTASGQLLAVVGTIAGNNRWIIAAGDGTTETGGNAGANFALFAYTDAGAFLSEPLIINRASGQTTLSVRPTWAGFTPYDTGNFNSAAVTGALGYTPAHSGANSDITSLTGLSTALSVSQGGTGSNSAAGARGNLGAAASGANTDITSLANLSTPLSVAQGGTGGNLSNWTSFTTTISTTGGSGMSVTDNGSQYLLMGKLLFLKYDFSLSFSTPPTTLNVNIPASLLVPLSWAFAGSNRSTGEALSVYNISSSQLTITRYDATAPAGTSGSGTRTFSVTGMCLVQ